MTEQLPPLWKMPPHHCLEPEKREQFLNALRQHYEAGATIEELMSRTDRGYTTIKNYLIASGATLRHKKTAIPPEVRVKIRTEMRKRYENGETMRKIAGRLRLRGIHGTCSPFGSENHATW